MGCCIQRHCKLESAICFLIYLGYEIAMSDFLSAVNAIDVASAEGGFSLSSNPLLTERVLSSSSLNRVSDRDRCFHDWYRFVLSFPPHLVKDYLVNHFKLSPGSVVLDPFCGTGTTVVEAKLNGFSGVGIEANAIAHLAGSTKINWGVDVDKLDLCALEVMRLCNKIYSGSSEPRSLEPEKEKLLLTNSISPVPLYKSLVLKEVCNSVDCEEGVRNILLVAFAKTLVFSASNLRFGPEVCVRGKKEDAPVFEAWLENIKQISSDLRSVGGQQYLNANIILADSRSMSGYLQKASIDAVFTSPPYPNEKDYTRTTRLESVLLDFINSKEELRAIKKTLLRSNTRGVYKGDEDDVWVAKYQSINQIADEIERRRIELGKNSGFEKLYARVTKLYFGGMAKHLSELRPFLKPGAKLGYVVGDQASYLRVMIRTGELLAEIARDLGYEVVSIDLFRTRISTATKAYMREEVLVLRWPGQ